MQVLSNFRQSSWIRMLKMHNMEQIGFPLGFFGKITAVYQMKKSFKLTPKMTNTQNFSFFTVFTQFLSIF